MKKRMLVIITTVLLVLSIGSSIALTSEQTFKQVADNVDTHITSTLNRFKDIASEEWYVSKVAKLVALGGIDGYTDGTFKPNNSITQGEFIKIVVAVFNGEEVSVSSGQHWAMNYVEKAEELSYIGEGEYKASDLDKPITRYQMSKIVVGVATSRGETFLPNRADYTYQIKDYPYVPEEYRCPVLKAYTQGIITGYPDGEFKGRQGLTRAEASTVIVRIFDEAERILPAAPVATSETKKIEEAISNPSAIGKSFKIISAQVFSVNPYEMMIYEGITGNSIKVKGLNNLYIIKDNKIIKLMESYPNPDAYIYHVIPDDVKLNEIDEFGAVAFGNNTMVIFPNPFKSR